MPISPSAMVSALNGLRLYSRRVDQAAERIASAGMFSIPTEPSPEPETPAAPPASSGESADLADAMVNMMVAQRAFAAQIRTIKTADQMQEELLRLTGGEPG